MENLGRATALRRSCIGGDQLAPATLAGNLDKSRGSETVSERASWSLVLRLCHFIPSPTQGALSLREH